MIGLYAGSFDPLTLGHENIIIRASKIFDKVFIAVLYNEAKSNLFTKEERIEMIKETTIKLGIKNVEVITFNGLLVDFVKKHNNMCIIKGLRNTIDFEQELSMAQGIKNLDSSVETLFLPTEVSLSFISSSMVKSTLYFNGDVSKMVNSVVLKRLKNKKEGKKYE